LSNRCRSGRNSRGRRFGKASSTSSNSPATPRLPGPMRSPARATMASAGSMPCAAYPARNVTRRSREGGYSGGATKRKGKIMNRASCVIAILVALTFCGVAQAMTGRDLYQHCAADPNSSQGIYCSAFFIGFSEGVYFGSSAGDHGIQICIPETATPSQIRAIWEQSMRDHPEDLDQEDRFTVALAIGAAFPCR